jgi:hypothetical protein
MQKAMASADHSISAAAVLLFMDKNPRYLAGSVRVNVDYIAPLLAPA